MFQTKTPVAVLAGMAVAGSILVAPGVVAAPTTGRAVAWGANGAGQLGDITAIEAGGSYSCAVADGKAYCWGRNQYAQLGKCVAPTWSDRLLRTGGLQPQ